MKDNLIDFETLKVGDKVWSVLDKKYVIIKSLTFSDGYSIATKERSYTKTGHYVSNDVNPSLLKRNPEELTNELIGERVIEVWKESAGIWVKRVYLKEFPNGIVVTWADVETLEEATKVSGTHTWGKWRELEEEKEVWLTAQDISDGKGVGIPPHLIRVKIAL